jgi:hypothetical protein
MKLFLTKITLATLIYFLLIIISIFILDFLIKYPFNSTSVSYNLKQEFIINNKKDISNSKYFVIGSSMSLNNIDCIKLSENLNKKIYNLSSWGMKFEDFNDFDIWDMDKTIIININFIDFGNSQISIFPKNSNKYFNIAQNISTYLSHIYQRYSALNIKSNDKYTSLNFDNHGSLIFTKKQYFKIDSTRWSWKNQELLNSEIDRFVNQIQEKSIKVNKLIIIFSPSRNYLYSSDKSKTISYLGSKLTKLKNVIFINNYENRGFIDDDFVDRDHFSMEGAIKYTNIV